MKYFARYLIIKKIRQHEAQCIRPICLHTKVLNCRWSSQFFSMIQYDEWLNIVAHPHIKNWCHIYGLRQAKYRCYRYSESVSRLNKMSLKHAPINPRTRLMTWQFSKYKMDAVAQNGCCQTKMVFQETYRSAYSSKSFILA